MCLVVKRGESRERDVAERGKATVRERKSGLREKVSVRCHPVTISDEWPHQENHSTRWIQCRRPASDPTWHAPTTCPRVAVRGQHLPDQNLRLVKIRNLDASVSQIRPLVIVKRAKFVSYHCYLFIDNYRVLTVTTTTILIFMIYTVYWLHRCSIARSLGLDSLLIRFWGIIVRFGEFWAKLKN